MARLLRLPPRRKWRRGEPSGKAAAAGGANRTARDTHAARRAKRKGVRCGCGYRNCKRHQRRAKRRGKPRKRKKRGHNSKNGRSATLVAMYTLKRDDAGRLHGPINKKLWGRFGSRRGAI